MGMRIQIPKKVAANIISDYKREKSLTHLKDKYPYKQSTLYRFLKNSEIDTTRDLISIGNRIRRHKIDENYFKAVDSRMKAYIFGWLMSDGYLHDSGSAYQIRLKIADIAILEAIKKEMKYDRELFHNKKEKKHHKQTKTLIISNMTMFQDVINLGCTPRKSLTKKFPTSVPEKYMPDFIRGYFDGNGCMYLFRQNGQPFIEIKICSSKYFAKGLFDKFQELGINCQVDRDKRAHKNTGQFRIRAIKAAVAFGDYIYANMKGQLCLERKRAKFIDFKKQRSL